MSRLVVVVPLKEGARARARELLEAGPPFELNDTAFDRHDVFLTEREVVFDPARKAVVLVRRRMYADLCLAEQTAPAEDRAEAATTSS